MNLAHVIRYLPRLLKIVVLVLFLALSPRGFSDNICESCRRDSRKVVSLSSYDGSFQRNICHHCIDNAPQCFVCMLPALKGSKTYDDNRLFCDRDFQAAIFAYEEMDRLAYQTTVDLNRAFWRFKMNFAISNVTVSLVSSATLYDLLELRFNPQQASIVGLTMTKCFDAEDKEIKLSERSKQPAGTQLRYQHDIYVANGFPEIKIKSTIAHELAHVWIHENLPFERANAIDRDTVEGFCELVAYQLMEHENAAHVRTSIRKNLYTVGQQNILIEVESGYGFNRILQWLYKGTNRRLQSADLIRQISDSPLPKQTSAVKPAVPMVQPATQTNAQPSELVAEAPQPQPASRPTTVILKGIFFGKNSSALINDLTLSEGEEQQLKLAEGFLGIKCLEIKQSSVILAVNGETKEFFVGRAPVDVVNGESK
ncbi:MAG: protein DA1 [Verrucomicrobia bacterium]|nr:protein DA1 [Verrucomicrobiota bacterium]